MWDLTPSPLHIFVGFNQVRSGQKGAEFLLENGYGKIGFGTAEDARTATRQQATLETFIKYWVTDITVAKVSEPSRMELGRLVPLSCSKNGFSGGAIFCSSDTLAQGVPAERQSRSIDAAKDVVIIGFGDQVFNTFTNPPLTTVTIDRKPIGHEAADALLARVSAQPIKNNIIDVGVTIIKRQTT